MLLSYSIALCNALSILTGLPVRNYVRAPSFIRRSRFSQSIYNSQAHTDTVYTNILRHDAKFKTHPIVEI